MATAWLMALQAAAAALPGPAPVPATEATAAAVRAIDFDLARLQRPELGLAGRRRCVRGTAEEILVCGARSNGAYPLDEMDRLFAPRPLVAEARLFGRATGRAYLEQAGIGPGLVSNRAMLGVRLPF